MPFKEGQLSLTGSLVEIPLKQALKKQLFGGRYLRFWDYFTFLNFQYESGAILGRAKRDRIDTLMNILVVPGTDAREFAAMMQKQARERLEKFKKELGKAPDTFYEFIFRRELDRVLAAVGLNLDKVFEEYMRGDKEVVKVFDRKVSLKDAWPLIQAYGAEGIGFGGSFPELTETMYKNSSENINMDEWTEVRNKMGVDIPEVPDMLSLEEKEKSVLGLAAVYVAEFWPELLDPLDLRNIIEKLDLEE